MTGLRPTLVLLAMLLVLATAARAQSPHPHRMPADQAHAAATAGTLVLIDIRTPDEWRETGVPASGWAVSMHQSGAGFLREIAAATGGDTAKPVAVICAVGSRSGAMQSALRRAGYTNVIDVPEGMIGGRNGAGWLKRGLPVRAWTQGSARPLQAQR